jgi:flagellar biosynthesis protein FlhF
MNFRKSFFSHSVESALAMARKEFGDEAYLVDSRTSRPEQRHLGGYEVIVETDSGSDLASPLASAARTQDPFLPANVPDSSSWSVLSQEVLQLRQELARLARLMHRPATWDRVVRERPFLAEFAGRLTAAEFPPDTVMELLAGCDSSGVETPDDLSLALSLVLRERLSGTAPTCLGSSRSIVALTGPPGSGKTTTIVKLAARYGVQANRSTLLVSADTCRVGGADQLSAYASILGVPCLLADTPGALVRILEEHARVSLVLIDTPGFSPADQELASEWARLLCTHPAIETHLLLPATHRLADLRTIMRQWALFRPSHLMITRLDETGCLGPVLTAALEAERPVSFFTAGQSIPEDLEPFNAGLLTQRLVPIAAPRKAAA